MKTKKKHGLIISISSAILLSLMMLSNTVFAETFTYIVPAKIDGGTSKWAQKFTKEWNKELKKEGHEVVLRYIPNNSGKKAFTKWFTEMSNDDTVIVQTKGFLNYFTAPGWKGFDPANVNVIGGQLQGTFVFIKTDATSPLTIPYAPTLLTDTMGIYLLLCGNQPVEYTLNCGKANTNTVIGFNGMGEMRMAFLQGATEVARDGFSHMKKTYKKELENKLARIWFTHGTIGYDGVMGIDPNTKNASNNFHTIFRALHGEDPSSEFYDAYITLSKMRSGLGKTIFTKHDNPYYDMLVNTMNETIVNSKKTLDKKLGLYPWHTGGTSNEMVTSIWDSIDDKTKDNIRNINANIQ